MKKQSALILIIGIFFLYASCGTFKKDLIQTGNQIDAIIHNSILDFSNTNKIYKRDTVFSVSILELNKNKGLLVVRISKNNMKMLLTDSTKVGSKGKLASRYLEKEGKLFFWWDDNYQLTQETLVMFNRYNLLLDNNIDGVTEFYNFGVNEAQKATHYYFCKNNLTKYKKVITNKGIGYYDVPKLDCD